MCLQSNRFRYACIVFLVDTDIRYTLGTLVCSGCQCLIWCAPYFFHIVSPYHSRSHCCFGRSGQGGSPFRADFPMSFSRRFLSIRRCLVAVVYEIPRRGFGSSCLQVLNSSRWSHIVIRCQTLSMVSSHERASASRVISSLEVNSQSFMTLSRSFLII